MLKRLLSSKELEARKIRSHLANNDCRLRSIFASIKSLTSGINLLCDLEKQMASEMAIKLSVSGD